jgi:hypothetical protein
MLRDGTAASADGTASSIEGTPATISCGWSRYARLETPGHGVECHLGQVEATVGQPERYPQRTDTNGQDG